MQTALQLQIKIIIILCKAVFAAAPSLHSYPVGSCHLHYHFDGGSAEVPAVAAHHHGAALAVPQVDGGQNTLNVILEVVLLALEHRCFLPQPVGTGPLIVERGGLDRHNRNGARLHPPRQGPSGWTRISQRICPS